MTFTFFINENLKINIYSKNRPVQLQCQVQLDKKLAGTITF